MIWNNDRLIRFSAAIPDFSEGRDTPRGFLERCLETIARDEDGLKAFVHLDLEGARAAADAASERYAQGRPLSPVDGCPLGVKDIIETADMPTQMGSPIYQGWHPVRDAACVRALRRGGAVIVGKTVTTEFAAGRSGPTVNPFDPTRTPGGSSSGSAASVGAGMLPAALGSQGGGSTIRPASYCGIFGFKATVHALSMAGIHTIGWTHDHLGILASNLEDLWSVARQISDGARTPGVTGLAGSGHELPRPEAPRQLIRIHTQGWQELDEATIAAFEEVVARLGAAGVEVVGRADDADIAALETELDDGVDGRYDVAAYEVEWPFGEYVDRFPDKTSESLHEYARHVQTLTPADYRDRLEKRRLMQARLNGLAGRADGFLSLASSGPAPEGLDYTGSRTFLNYWSWVGFPALSLPLMSVDGLPVGVQLIGYEGADDRLAGHAAWIMRELG